MSEFDGEWTRRRPDGWLEDADDQNPPEPERKRRSRLIDAGAIVGLLVVTGSLAAAAYHNRKDAFKRPVAVTEAPLATACPAPSNQEVAAVERLFTEPVAKARAEYRQRGLTAYEREGSLAVTNFFGATAPQTMYYENDFFKHYGLSVEFASQADKSDGTLRSPNLNEIYSDSASVNLEGIMAGLTEMPAHYVIMSGLKTIRLMAGDKHTLFVWQDNHTLDWNINISYPNPDPVPAEVGLALGGFTENKLCGPDGTSNDQVFNAVSQGPFPEINKIGPPGHITTMDDYDYKHAPAADVKTINSWSAENTFSDKASLLSLVGVPEETASYMSPDHPILRAKEIEVLAELYHRQPAVVRRLAFEAGKYPMFGKDHNTPAGSRHDIPYTEWAQQNNLASYQSDGSTH